MIIFCYKLNGAVVAKIAAHNIVEADAIFEMDSGAALAKSNVTVSIPSYPLHKPNQI